MAYARSAIFRDPDSGNYYIYCTGAICQRSRDLIHWEMVGKVVEKPPVESAEWAGSDDIWAPDIVKVGKRVSSVLLKFHLGRAAVLHLSGSFRFPGRTVCSARLRIKDE